MTNREIVEELSRGDRSGCNHLVEVYQARLIQEAVGVFGLHHADAEEVVSDALLAVVTNIHSFAFKRSDSDFHVWVTTIFRNRVRDFIRRQSITAGLIKNFDEAALEDDVSYTAGEHGVIAEIVRQYQNSLRTDRVSERDAAIAEKLRVIEETLEKLPSWERVLLRCRALEVPFEEIAKYTGKPANILKVYHARVKKKFVKTLAQKFPEIVSHET